MKKILMILVFSIVSAFAFEELNIDNFEEKIKGKNAIVDFYAVWCPPCKVLDRNLKDFDEIKPEGVTIFKLNIDEEPMITRKYDVTKLPTLVYFKDGKPVKTMVGIQSISGLIDSSQKYFNLK